MFVLHDILWLLVLIGVMILIHELGHFWAARYFDVKVETFSFGFGPRLFGFRKGETDYRFSAILFGGYVKMAGEQPGDENAADPRGFLSKPRWQRLIIAFAGPFMNIVLAVSLLTGVYMVKFQRPAKSENDAVVGHVIPGSPAEKAGVQAGDRIVRIDGADTPTWQSIGLKEVSSAAKTLDVTLDRDGKRIETKVTPVLDDREGIGTAGWEERSEIEVGDISPGMPAQKAGLLRGDLLLSVNGQKINSRYTLLDVIRKTDGKPVTIEYVRNGVQHSVTMNPVFSKSDGKPRWMIGVGPMQKINLITTKLSFPDALRESVHQNLQGATLIFGFLKGMLERRMSAKSLQGPIGIARLSGEAAREGPSVFFQLMTMVSLNLAIFNLLPIPILDGGMILLLLVEMLMGRDLSMNVREAVFKVGFVFLMVVVVFVLYNDITKILPG
ncbi:MAG: RIP metalloprotease RseP [Acidobacteriota bacterium]|nr:RIP metalloprotease RseP [Acidobacteriota bacterium]